MGRMFPVNVGAPTILMQLAAPLLSLRRGLIVNITSDAATAAYPGWGPYGATKAALELLTRTLAAELRDQGVSALLVDPGDMRTRMHQQAFPGEDISDRPLPEVTVPFWNWLFDQDPEEIRGQRFAAQQEDARWLQQACSTRSRCRRISGRRSRRKRAGSSATTCACSSPTSIPTRSLTRDSATCRDGSRQATSSWSTPAVR